MNKIENLLLIYRINSGIWPGYLQEVLKAGRNKILIEPVSAIRPFFPGQDKVCRREALSFIRARSLNRFKICLNEELQMASANDRLIRKSAGFLSDKYLP